jgi:ABC-type multidrug transport system fused ATPase/permease subunit
VTSNADFVREHVGSAGPLAAPRAGSRQVDAKRLVGELAPYRKPLALGLVLMLISAPAGMFHPFIWMYVVDDVLTRRHIEHLVPALSVMVAIQAFAIALGAVQDRIFERVGQTFVRDLRNRVYAKLGRQSLGYMHRHRSGDLLSRVVSDVDAMQGSLVAGVTSTLGELVSFVGALGSVLYINWRVGILTVVPLTIVFFMVRAFNVRVKALYAQARERLGRVSARLSDNLQGFHLIKSFNAEAVEEKRFSEATAAHFDKTMEAVALRTRIFPSVFFVGFLTNVIMLGLGAFFVWRGEFTLGGLVAFRGFWWQLNSPIRTLAQVNDLLQRALASSRRVYEVLDAPEEIVDAKAATPVASLRVPLRVEHVSFAYPNGKPVFSDLDLEIMPGQTVALAGPSGAGKSTLLGLLMRFYDPTGGRIMVGARPLTSVTQASLRRHMAMVLQDTFLFNDTVFENLRYGRPDAAREEVVAAARRANAHDFIAALPNGYDTEIGERGIKLSGGQRQRISVARAFLADPDVLLLDEPTSSVEPESEQIISQSIDHLMQGRTTIITSHRPSLLRGADRIFFIHHGKVWEEGTHAELTAKDGLYASMYRGWEESSKADAFLSRATPAASIAS